MGLVAHSTSLSAFHAAVLDLAGLLERPLVLRPAGGAQVCAHGAPASVAVKPHHSHHHHPSATSSAASGSENGDDRPSSSGSGSNGRLDDFEGLNFAQVRSERRVPPFLFRN